MTKPSTAQNNGRLWGRRARDWAEIQEATVRSVYRAVLERMKVGSGTLYLDIGCGAGLAAQMAARQGARVCGLDAAEPLLEIARARVPQGDFRHGDLEALPFGDAGFDLVTGFNAFQYAASPVVALREAGRVAKKHGAIVIMTWGTPEGMAAASVVAALKPLLPPPPPGAPGPFALSDESALRAFASQAGLTPVEIFDVDSPFLYPDEATALRGLNSSGVAARAMENSGEDTVTMAHAAAIAPFRQPDGGYRIGAWFRCLMARP